MVDQLSVGLGNLLGEELEVRLLGAEGKAGDDVLLLLIVVYVV